MQKMKKYLNGELLYGDDFNPDQIKQWLKDEGKAYLEMVREYGYTSQYEYHALNQIYGFSHLPNKSYRALGFGSAYGDEFKPIIHRIKELTIVDYLDFSKDNKLNFPIKYKKPQFNGDINLKNNSVDLIVCLGVLHHLPNVSKVLREFYRCLKKKGYILLREPIVSMGDWRKNRPGLTKRERGIPLNILRKIILSNKFKIIAEQKCMFPLIPLLNPFIKYSYNSKTIVKIDKFLCSSPNWDTTYHPKSLFDKIQPTSVFYVLIKE